MDTFVPRWFLLYLRVSGIFSGGSTNKGQSRNKIQDTIQILSAVFASVLIMAMLADNCLHYLQDVSTLDFFVIISFISRVNSSQQAVLMFFMFFIQRHRIRKLLSEISVIVQEVLAPEETRKWFVKSSSSVICWLFLCHGAHLAIYYMVVYILDTGKDAYAAVPVFGVDERYTMPRWTFRTIPVVSYFLTLNTDLAGQMFYFIAISIMTRVMVKINQIASYQFLVESKVTVDAVDAVFSLIQRMRRLYRRFNWAFGYIIFLNCVRDLIALVALMSMLLQANVRQIPGESSVDYDSRVRSTEVIKRFFLCQTVISVANAFLRALICVRSQNQVLSKCKNH